MTHEYKHTPVLFDEVLSYLDPRAGRLYIDCTVGGGGYALALAKDIAPGGEVVGIDVDKMAIDHLSSQIQKTKNITLIHDNFKDLFEIYKKIKPSARAKGAFGVIFDLGLSSAQLEDRSRGFSFQLDAPLDMAFGHDIRIKRIETKRTNYDTQYIINKYPEKELADIIYKFGEERYSRRIARAIVAARKERPVKTTNELVEIIKRAVPASYLRRRIHFATRTFQALRIATNNELENLELALPQAVDILAPGGRLIVISYHSLEDRLVKNYFKQESRDCVCPKETPDCRCEHKTSLKIITKKVIKAGEEEIKQNVRARSAKMRVAEKI